MTHEAGGKSSWPMPEGVTGDALFSGPDACYRLELRRSWRVICERLGATSSYTTREAAFAPPYTMWLGLNPSTADGDMNDPTISRECTLTATIGGNAYLKMNVSPYRATDPSRLAYAAVPLLPSGHTERVLRRAMRAERTVVACGVPPAPLLTVAENLFELLDWCGVELWALGTTLDGWPRHPLYLPADAPMARWYGRAQGFGPVHRLYDPDGGTPPEFGGFFEIGEAYFYPAPKARRLRDVLIYQCVDYINGNMNSPVFVPAAHLARQFADRIDIWARKAAA